MQWHHGSMSAKMHACTPTYLAPQPDFHQRKATQTEKELQHPCNVTFLLGVIGGTGQLSMLCNKLERITYSMNLALSFISFF